MNGHTRPQQKHFSLAIGSGILGVCLLCAPAVRAATVGVFFDRDNARCRFAVDDISEALTARGHEVQLHDLSPPDTAGNEQRIVLALRSNHDVGEKMKSAGAAASDALRSEGFSLRVTVVDGRRTCWVIGADTAGLMYGGLELAEQLRIGDLAGVKRADQNPYMVMRGTKFNIPLDARTPSYSDVCDAAQQNIAEMWSFDFWRDYIDNLARHRYNFVSLWSLHPFPSMVKVPDYPDVALNDVKRSTVAWDEYYSGNGKGFDSPEILDHLETLKKLTIEEKIAFWQRVMRHGRDRNIRFYVVTWNIFVNGTYGKYGITEDINNSTTVDYFRKSVRQMFLTYPDLAGVGLTTGENMPKATFKQKEDWAFATYGRGVLDAAARFPGRKMTLIHRQHQTGATDIAHKFQPLIENPNTRFLFSFKYAKAHVYSSVRQPYHKEFVKDIGGLKTIWTLRNDDVYHFRWGAPDFVRQFLQNIPHDVSQGFYLGSDQYIWGREFLSTEPDQPRQLEVAKHWYHWMIWGRLGYDPTLSDERFARILQARYPMVAGSDLFTAWQEASLIYPLTTGFHWGALDFQWYIEACKSRPGPAQTASGFHDVNRFITLAPHPGTDNISIPDYVKLVDRHAEIRGTSPPAVADQIQRHAENALRIVNQLQPHGDKELRLTLGDIRAMAYLGKYYAHKIRGATELALYRSNRQKEHRDLAVEQLNEAATYWRRYASTALGQYKDPLWTNRVGYCDWRGLFEHVLHDVEVAGGTPRPASMLATPGGTVLEAEEARVQGLARANQIKGYTGGGYLGYAGGQSNARVEWSFNAPAAGSYVLEFRYTLRDPGRQALPLRINGSPSGSLICWTTGGASTWAWDHVPVVFRKGDNTIDLAVNGPIQIDHLNVLSGAATKR